MEHDVAAYPSASAKAAAEAVAALREDAAAREDGKEGEGGGKNNKKRKKKKRRASEAVVSGEPCGVFGLELGAVSRSLRLDMRKYRAPSFGLRYTILRGIRVYYTI